MCGKFFLRSIKMIGLVYFHIFCNLLSLVSGIEESSTSNLIPCMEGGYLFGEKCYKVFGQTDPQTWNDASLTCRSWGGYLATVNSKGLHDFLTIFMIMDERSHLWIGLHDRNIESEYTWDDGSIVNYTNWQPGEPHKGYDLSEDCVVMAFRSKDKIGMWNDLPCDKRLPFICQLNKTSKASSPDLRFCTLEKDGGWKYSNSCYHIIERKASWEDAEVYCQRKFGGHLVSILNSGTEMFLDYILSNTMMDFWIGIKIRDHDMQKWSSGWHLVFNKWSDEQGLVNGNCGLRKSPNQWISENCAEKHPFICEKSSHKPPVYKQEEWRCPGPSKEWKDLDGDSCYIIENTKSLNWYEANYDCMTKGGTLARILSEDASKAIHHHVIGGPERLLIGLHRKLDDKNTFQWLDGTEIDYQNWDSGEPSSLSEECGELWTESMKWNDGGCNQKKGYICSAKKLPPLFNEENQPPIHTLQDEEFHCQDDTILQIVMITLVCIIVFSVLVGVVIYIVKIRCKKDFQFSSLRDIIQDRYRFSNVKHSSDILDE